MIKKLIRFFVFCGALLIIIASILGLQFYQFTRSPLAVGNGYVLVIASGTSVQKIAEQLMNDGVLKSTGSFLLWVRWQNAWSALKAGEYLIKPGTTPTQLIEQLKEGKVIQHVLTIVPGWTFQHLMEVVNQEPSLSHLLVGLKPEDIMIKLGHPGEHPEGRFLADTYYFPAGTTDVAFLQRAYNQLHDKLAMVWNQRSVAETKTLKSAYEALTLASIIEKESSTIEEYADISGVYIRRLEQGMPLQADPTVIYGVGKEYAGQITKEMLNTETPYNTYRIKGLPPTPIAFPSLRALEASVHPRSGDALYFVARPNGRGHEFSKTLNEHQDAVDRYRRGVDTTLPQSTTVLPVAPEYIPNPSEPNVPAPVFPNDPNVAPAVPSATSVPNVPAPAVPSATSVPNVPVPVAPVAPEPRAPTSSERPSPEQTNPTSNP